MIKILKILLLFLRVGLRLFANMEGVLLLFLSSFRHKKTKTGNQTNFVWVGFYLLMQK